MHAWTRPYETRHLDLYPPLQKIKTHPIQGVLKDQAVRRGHPQALGRRQVYVRGRLATLDLMKWKMSGRGGGCT